MSKVLYERTGNPEKEGIYFVLAEGEVQTMEFRNGEWAYPVYCWYSETPGPELAEVLDLLKQHSDREMYTLHKEEIQTLLNELLN